MIQNDVVFGIWELVLDGPKAQGIVAIQMNPNETSVSKVVWSCSYSVVLTHIQEGYQYHATYEIPSTPLSPLGCVAFEGASKRLAAIRYVPAVSLLI